MRCGEVRLVYAGIRTYYHQSMPFNGVTEAACECTSNDLCRDADFTSRTFLPAQLEDLTRPEEPLDDQQHDERDRDE
jgi:hypothetical protein